MADKHRLQNGSDPSGALIRADYASTPRSAFDYSCLFSATADIGAIIPVDCFKVIPGDSVKLANDILVTISNPLVQRMMSSCRIFTHSYYMKCSDMWLGWQNYIDRGTSGTLQLTLPSVQLDQSYYVVKPFSDSIVATSLGANVVTPMSLFGYLVGHGLRYAPSNYYHIAGSGGLFDAEWHNSMSSWLPYGFSFTSTGLLSPTGQPVIAATPASVNALPFFMYQSIYKHYFAPKNLMRDNKNWYPDNVRDWILPYSCPDPVVSAYHLSDTIHPNASVFSAGVYSPVPLGAAAELTGSQPGSFWDCPTLLGLRYRQWRGDEFTAGLPWLERGNPANLSLFTAMTVDNTSPAAIAQSILHAPSSSHVFYDHLNQGFSTYIGSVNSAFATAVPPTPGAGNGIVPYPQLSILTMNMLRQLSAWTQFQERNATLDGTYNDFIKARFGRNPHAEDYVPRYIGGTVQNLVFSEVLQTSEDANTPLGTQAGRAVSASSNYIGQFDVDDYGYVMTVMEIVPDVMYAQGLPKYLEGGVTSDTEVFPEFVNLPPEPIKKSELFVSGVSSVDNDLFAYRERYGDYKSRNNRVAGLLSLPPEKDNFFASYTFSRWFSESQELNPDFVTMSPRTVRRDMFAVPSQPMFVFQCANRVDLVRPLPRDARTMSLTNQL